MSILKGLFGFQWYNYRMSQVEGGPRFQSSLEFDIDWRRRDLEAMREGRPGYEGAIDGWGSYELGVTVEEALRRIRELAATKKPGALLISGAKIIWGEGEFSDTFRKVLPEITGERGFTSDVVLDLGLQLGVFPRTSPDTLIFEDPSGYEQETTYDLVPVRSPLVPHVTTWHELTRGYEHHARSSALVTVNRPYFTTDRATVELNKVALRSEGFRV